MNTEIELYGIEIKTEVIALIKVNNKFESFSKGALKEILQSLDNSKYRPKILKTFDKTYNEMVQICNTSIKLIEDES